MGPRAWAAIGNYLRISAVGGFVGFALFGAMAIELNQRGAPGSAVLVPVGLSIVAFVSAVLVWNAKGPLVSGNLIVRLLVGGWMLVGVISSLGLELLIIGIVYLFTAEPDETEVYGRAKKPKPRFKAPHSWQATGRVGPSGATIYSDAIGGDQAGIFDSFTPVQVTDRRDGLAHVIAATGEHGWIDTRVLT